MDTSDATQIPLEEIPAPAAAPEAKAPETKADSPETGETEAEDAKAQESEEPEEGPETPAEASHDDGLIPDRKRIEEQLDALKRREAQLRRELAMADHPDLADAIRQLEGAAYCVTRADAKLEQGLTKAEERRRDTLSKKVDGLQEKRDKLDAQLSELKAELAVLGEERIQGFQAERREALQRLVANLGSHAAALKAANLEVGELLPQVGEWMPEIRALAEELAAGRTRA